MNRKYHTTLGTLITLAAFAAAPRGFGDDVLKNYESRSITFTGGEYTDQPFKYRLLKPANMEAGKKYPLVLFLHGAGERGTDNEKSLLYMPNWWAHEEMQRSHPCYILVPQCPNNRMFINFAWNLKEHTMSEKPNEVMQAVIQMLRHTMDNEQVDEDRVYLTGLSMGGFGSWELASRHPEWFAAVAPICGGGDPKQAAKLKDLPIWAWHGTDDTAVVVDRSRQMIEAIKAAGGKPRYTELEHIGHNSWATAYNTPDFVNWMFSQSRAKTR